MNNQSVTDPTLEPFFAPRGVAVIGISRRPAKLGYGIAQNLVRSGYGGAIHFVNPRGGTLFGRPIYADISAVPDPVDLAVILVPPQLVPETVAACGARGIPAAIVASGGFREVGAEGAALEAQMLTTAASYNMRLIGPNCIGIIDTHLPLDTTFLPPPGPPAGDIAFLSHSGAFAAAVVDWARAEGFGFSRIVSLGNAADVNEADLLQPVAADPQTRVIALYLESINDGHHLLHAAATTVVEKPVIALKAGRHAAGQRAASSHTGALTGTDDAVDAAFRRAGIIRAETAADMFNWARVLAWCPPPRGRRVAVLTNAGGPGVMAVDALERGGLLLSSLHEKTCAALEAVLPPAASADNPVDMLASASPEHYAEGLRLLLDDENVDAVLLILPPPPMFAAGGVARLLVPVIQSTDKPVLVALMGHELVGEARAFLRGARIPTFPFPEPAAAALAALAARATFLEQLPQPTLSLAAANRSAARQALESQAEGWLPPQKLQQLLQAYRIPQPAGRLATTADEAAAFAAELGAPVVLKIAAEHIAHKSDIGGVLLDLDVAYAIRSGFQTLMQRAKTAGKSGAVDGVLVQQMVPPGQDLILGVTRDPQFGPLLMFGAGGVEVEGLRDVAFALAPPTAADLDHLLSQTWAGRRLQGYRDLAAVDSAAVRDVIVRLGHLASDLPQIAEIEINPLRALPDGVLALDARARLQEPA